MSKQNSATSREGSATAADIYLAVGVALSWWESSEDIREMLFACLCGTKEPIASETFRIAPRQSRNEMVKSALKYHSEKVNPKQATEVADALNSLEKLAPMRNQIAHGYVSKVHQTVDGLVWMEGYFLISTLDPKGAVSPRSENRKYALTAAQIEDWTNKVRYQRGRLIDVWTALTKRD